MIVKPLKIASIRLDGGTQPRAEIDFSTVQDYAEAIRRGDKFPAPVVYYDGTDYWLADGFHRVKARESIDTKSPIECEVRAGTREDAVWHSCGANRDHGLPRKNVDKRRAVATALRLERSREMSDRSLAEYCGVSTTLITSVKGDVLFNNTPPEHRTSKDGHNKGGTSEQRSAAGKASAAARRARKEASSPPSSAPETESSPTFEGETEAPPAPPPEPVGVAVATRPPERPPVEPSETLHTRRLREARAFFDGSGLRRDQVIEILKTLLVSYQREAA